MHTPKAEGTPGRPDDIGSRIQPSARLDQNLVQIRQDDDFADFWTAPAPDLLLAAAQGPVVLPVMSRYGSHALILGKGKPLRALLLADLPPDDLINHPPRPARV